MESSRYCNDRIWMAFDGDLGGLQEQKARDRIAWIVNNAKGNTVFDIGCSQGIASVLLGRKGYQVLGIDIDPDTIVFAREKLAGEDEETRKKVTFEREDFLIGYNKAECYDTIIMTEVLEHLTNPGLFVRKAASILAKDGVMLITVPFGINEHPDHKQTFYGESAMRVIQKYATVLSVEFYKGWIGIIATDLRESAGRTEFDWHRMVVEEEDGFHKIEQEIRESNKKLKARTEKLISQLETVQADHEQLKEKKKELEETVKQARKDISQKEDQKRVAEIRLEMVQKDNRQLESQLETVQREKNELDRTKAGLESHLNYLLAQNSQLADEKRDIKTQLNNSRAQNRQLGDEKRDLEALLKSTQTENIHLGDAKRQSEAKKQDLEARLESADRKNREQEEQIRQLTAQKKTLYIINGKYKERIDTLTEQRNRLKGQKENLQKELSFGGTVKRAVRKIPFVVPITCLLKGDRDGAKRYYAEKRQYKLEKKQGKTGVTAESALREYQEKPGTAPASGPVKDESQKKAVPAAIPDKKPEKPAAKKEPPVEYDMGYFDRISDKVALIPESNGTRYYQKHSGKVGWLAEQFRYDAFHSAIDGVVLTPENWHEEINHIDYLLVTSGWRGVNNAWPGLGKPQSEIRQIIYQVIETCREKGIPTVFYSVEDPPNYLIFIEIAKRCDYVFTAAEEVIPQYREDCGHDRVYNLKVPINPLLHNPVGMRKVDRSDKVFFAGSWMPKYPERLVDTRMLFDGIQKAARGLRIIDRNLMRPEVKYRFPPEYAQYVAPPVDHETLQKIQKMYDWGLTLNSVKRSRTMFANRAYEMLALGNLIISDDCTGIKAQLPTAFTCENSDKVARILESTTPEEAYEREIAGLRFVFQKDTCFDRMKILLDTIGRPSESNIRKVAVVIDSDDPGSNDSFIRQTYTEKTALKPDEWLAQADEFDAVTFFDTDSFYGDFYLEDMMNGFKYTDSDYVTKAAYCRNGALIAGTEHDYVSVMPDKFRTVFWKGTMQPGQLVQLEGSMELPNGYSIDHFEFDADYHPISKETADAKLTVILPAKNNGWFLYGKAFSSLRRNPLFEQMEIICLDIGSTDNRNTSGLLHMLERRYRNVKVLPEIEADAANLTDAVMKAIRQAGCSWAAVLPAEEETEPMTYQTLLKRAEEAGDKPVIRLYPDRQTIGETLFRTGLPENEPLQRSIIENAFG